MNTAHRATNIWTAPLETLRARKSAPEARARRAFAAELYGAPSTAAEAFGASPEAWTLAVGAALELEAAQAMVARLGFKRAAAIATYARTVGLDPLQLAGIANTNR